MKQRPLLTWGLACILGGIFAKAFTPPPANADEALGIGLATLAFWVFGLTLISLHFIRRDKTGKEEKPKKKDDYKW